MVSRFSFLRLGGFAVWLLLFTACGDDSLHRMPRQAAPVPAPIAPADPAPPADPDPVEEPPAPEDDCTGVEDAIYVIDKDTQAMYTYDPQDSSFTHLADIDCGAYAGTPASMSVARDGVAYLRYADDSLYALDLETMSCTPTSYQSNFGHFGMGFATRRVDGWEDEMFVANRRHLARLNTTTWRIETLGELPSQSELSGNTYGELWAMLPLERPALLAQLDKVSGRLKRRIALPGLPEPQRIDTFAFATWDRQFYVFVREHGMGESTTVYRIDETGVLTVHDSDTGLNIVGAGVSTCAR
jgi:hypothetical protein